VKARIEHNQGQPLWPLLEERWKAILDHCQRYLAMCERGVPFQKHERRACHELSKLAGHVEARTVVETALALFLMLDQEPRRFQTDRGFLFQLVRRVRGLADVNAGKYYDHGSGKVKRVYRDLPPRATESLGTIVVEAFGAAGVHLAQLERQQAGQDRAVVQTFHDALAQIA
jgi:uncharacterized protein (DUF924 family)